MNIIIDRTWKQGSLVNIEDLRGLTFQAEAQAHTFRISGVDAAGNPITLTGTPSGVMLRPDNTDVALTCAVSDGKVTATLPAECYDVPGRVGIAIYLTSNSQKVCIYSAITSVNRTSSGTASPGTTSSVVDLVNAIEAAIAQIPASDTNLKGALAPTYSDSAVYAVGQYAWYDGKLYKCTTAITTSESWTSGHWAEAKLAQDVCDLKSAIKLSDKIISGVNSKLVKSTGINLMPQLASGDFIDGHVIIDGGSIVETSYWSYTKLIEVEPITEYGCYLIPQFGSALYPWNTNAFGSNAIAFYDVDGNYIRSVTPIDGLFTTDISTRYIRINAYSSLGIGRNVINSKCMLVKGSSVPANYSSYSSAYTYYDFSQMESDIETINSTLTPSAELISGSNYRIVVKRQVP